MNGKLSTHALDNYLGKPAAGLSWSLHFLYASQSWTPIAKGVTTADGRSQAPILVGEELLTGKYRLSFEVADYYAGLDVPQANPPFLETVSLTVNLISGESYHVPLLMTPWSYSTYRGS